MVEKTAASERVRIEAAAASLWAPFSDVRIEEPPQFAVGMGRVCRVGSASAHLERKP